MKLMAAAALAAALGSGQWLNTPMPGAPRTPDGKVDLNAPAPKSADGHPDLSGVWTPNSRPLQDLSVGVPDRDVPYLPWSAQLTKERAGGALYEGFTTFRQIFTDGRARRKIPSRRGSATRSANGTATPSSSRRSA